MIPGILMIKGNGAKYLFPEEKFEIKNIIRWERNVRRGKAKKYVWEPDNRGKNVITLVETTIENAIRDPKKDVLVMYSAPWCEQCTMVCISNIYIYIYSLNHTMRKLGNTLLRMKILLSQRLMPLLTM